MDGLMDGTSAVPGIGNIEPNSYYASPRSEGGPNPGTGSNTIPHRTHRRELHSLTSSQPVHTRPGATLAIGVVATRAVGTGAFNAVLRVDGNGAPPADASADAGTGG